MAAAARKAGLASSSTKPMSAGSSSGPVSLEKDLYENGLVAYSLKAPSWRAPWLATHDNSGTPQFYPTVEGQDEDQLTEQAVKSGFVTESFSAHQLIYEKLKGDSILPALSKLASAVAERVQARVPSYGPPAFRYPQRLTLNEAKRESWVNDLANPAVPLSKLARAVPHGFRGEKLIDMLTVRQVPIQRAVWYIRAIGSSDIQTQIKSRRDAGVSVAQYTREWSGVVQEYVRKQLAEIALPDAPPSLAASLSASTSSSKPLAKNVLSDAELRSNWSTRFGYTLRLLEALYEESLIEQESFLRFIVLQVEASNIGQLPFALFLAEEYLGEFLLSEPLSARLANACFTRLKDMLSEPTTSPHLEETSHALSSIIRSTFIALPDAFVAGPLWTKYSKQLESTMLATPGLEPSLSETIRADLADLKARAEASSEATQDEESLEPDELEMIQILDDIAFPVDLASVHKNLFHKRRRRQPVSNDLNILFSWATTPDRSGSHRAYAVASLIGMELEFSAGSDTVLNVEAGFIRWIDDGMVGDRWAVTSLLAELIRGGVMSYSLYLQKMIARGETEQRKGACPSLHLHLLRTVALFGEAGQSLAKRRIAMLAGSKATDESKRLIERAELELESVIPGVVNHTSATSPLPPNRDCTALLTALDQLAKDGSHLSLTRQTIPHAVARFLRHSGTDRQLSVEDHAILAQVYLAVEDMWGLLQYLILLLRSQPSRDLLFHILDIVESNLVGWTSMVALPSLSQALVVAHEGLKLHNIHDRRLFALLRQLGGAGHLDAAVFGQIEQDFQSHVLSLSSRGTQTQGVPATLPDLAALATDVSPQAMTQLATTLWYRYHGFDNWGQLVFEGVIRLLPQVPIPTISAFLREINERLPAGLEPCVTRWMSGMSPTSLSATLGGPLAPIIAQLLGELVLEGTVSPSGAVTSIILPAWHVLLTNITTPPPPFNPGMVMEDKTPHLRGLETISSIFGSLIGCDPTRDPSQSPAEILLRQRAESRRASLYTPTVLPDLGRCIAMLAIQQELYTSRADYEKSHVSSTLSLHVCGDPSFKMAIARDPQSLASAMLDSPSISNLPTARSFRPKLLAALLLILKDGSTTTPASLVSTEDWDLFLSGLTIWRLAVSKVEVQAALERLALDTSLQDSEKVEALNTLSRHFLDRVCSGEGHTYLGEQVIRCYHGRASDELVSVAFSRLAEAVDGLAETASPELRASSLTTLRCTGRLLNTLLQSSSAASRPGPLIQLLVAVRTCLEALLELDAPPQREVVLHLALLIGIALRCAPAYSPPVLQGLPLASAPTTAPPEWCERFQECLVPSARLAAVLSKNTATECDLSSILLDTCAHLLFSVTTMAPSIRLPTLQTLQSLGNDFDTVPDAILSRLTRLFGSQSYPSVPTANPWDLLDQADAVPLKANDVRPNVGPIDLALFDAKLIEPLSAITALDVPMSPATSSGHSEKGVQTNFDFETPCQGLSLAARDFRRTLAGGKAFVSRYDPQAKANKEREKMEKEKEAREKQREMREKERERVEREKELIVVESPTPKGSASKKRKEAPQTEILVLSDDEEPLGAKAQAPPAKKVKSSSGTGGKTTSGKSGSKKKPK
ncbi:Mediator complex, subunit Med12 [Pseudohyphozyma bogoriensis]|nr:Mediator complex, subunit Med12 [Pseudohyphozyma bogoriensis]